MKDDLINVDFTDYLPINETVEFVKQHSNNKFFSESSLFDCVILRKIKPIIFFDGYCLSTPNIEYCYNPKDFEKLESGDVKLENNYNSIFQSQLDVVQGYFYIQSINNTVMSFDDDIEFRNAQIHQLSQDGCGLRNLALSGFSDEGHCYFATPIQCSSFLMLSEKQVNHFDELDFLTVKKKDLRFSIKDLIKITDFYIIQNKEIEIIKENCSNSNWLNRELKKENELLRIENEHLKSKNIDKELTYKSQNSISRLLYALMENGDFQLDGTKKGNLNDRLVSLTKEKGVPVTEKFIADWLEYLNDKYYFKKGK